MNENTNISEFDNVFRQQLENASTQPPPGIWEGISAGLSTPATVTTAVATVKTALWVKLGIGAIVTAAVASAIYLSIPSKVSPVRLTEPVSVVAPKIDNEPVKAEQTTPSGTSEEQKQQQVSATTIQKDKESKLQEKEHTAGIHVVGKQKDEQTEKYDFSFDPSIIKQDKAPIMDDQPVKIETTNAEPPYEPKNESYVTKTDSAFIFIPDVVTPNGDGLNDVYLIDIKGEERVRIMIFSLSMNKLFESTNKLVPWSCTMPNGELYPAGSYIVKVIYKFPGSAEKMKTVTLKLIR